MKKDYLIWSNEHQAWWGPGSRGYTQRILDAGMYSRAEAKMIVDNATFNWNLVPNEVPIWLNDLPDAIVLQLSRKAPRTGISDDS